jgi:hypothetical protein
MTARVFLCEPSGLSSGQSAVSDRWHERLSELGFDIDQLRLGAYEDDPWPGLLRRIGAADGVLVLGFRQLIVHSGTWREGAEEEAGIRASWTSPWLQVEAGIALAADVPVLVAPEPGVSEGVFEPGTWSGTLHGTSAEMPDPDVLAAWARMVSARASGT